MGVQILKSKYIKRERIEKFVDKLKDQAQTCRQLRDKFSKFSCDRAIQNARAEAISLVILKMEEYFDISKSEEGDGESDRRGNNAPSTGASQD